MKASGVHLISVLTDSTSGGRFVVPVYQRNYKWDKENCKRLLDDIVLAARNNQDHFIGSLVTVPVDGENNLKNHIIVDGQQRLTTIFLILQILYELYKNKGNGLQSLKIAEILHIDSNGISNDSKLKLKLIKSDDEQFQNLLLEDRKGLVLDENSNIVKNYNTLKKEIKTYCLENNFDSVLYGIKKLTCVWIELDEKDKPQEVFESINSTGKPLTTADLIRNYLLMTERDQDALFKNYWVNIETNIRDSDPQNEEKNLGEFFRHFLIMEKKTTGFSKKEVYRTFVKYVNGRKNDNGDDNESILKDLRVYSYIYSMLLKGEYPRDEEIGYYLYLIKCIGQTTLFPFLMKLFYNLDYGNLEIEKVDICDVKKTLEFLLKYFLRRMITECDTNIYNDLFANLYLKCSDGGCFTYSNLLAYFATYTWNPYSKERVPQDGDIKNSLSVMPIYDKKSICKPILEILENSMGQRMYVKGCGDVDFNNYSIERIMPENIKNWKAKLETISNWDEEFTRLLNTIGNLTLTRMNSEMSNKGFLEKKYASHQANDHLRYLNIDAYDDETKREWTFADIEKRESRFVNALLDVLRIELPKSERKDYYTLNDDLKHKKVVCVSIDNIKMDVENASGLLLKITKYLFKTYDVIAYNKLHTGELPKFITQGKDFWSGKKDSDIDHIVNDVYLYNPNRNYDHVCSLCVKVISAIAPELIPTVKIYCEN